MLIRSGRLTAETRALRTGGRRNAQAQQIMTKNDVPNGQGFRRGAERKSRMLRLQTDYLRLQKELEEKEDKLKDREENQEGNVPLQTALSRIRKDQDPRLKMKMSGIFRTKQERSLEKSNAAE